MGFPDGQEWEGSWEEARMIPVLGTWGSEE